MSVAKEIMEVMPPKYKTIWLESHL
jgi:hypothetical protein